jgi:hypothetical protein
MKREAEVTWITVGCRVRRIHDEHSGEPRGVDWIVERLFVSPHYGRLFARIRADVSTCGRTGLKRYVRVVNLIPAPHF